MLHGFVNLKNIQTWCPFLVYIDQLFAGFTAFNLHQVADNVMFFVLHIIFITDDTSLSYLLILSEGRASWAWPRIPDHGKHPLQVWRLVYQDMVRKHCQQEE